MDRKEDHLLKLPAFDEFHRDGQVLSRRPIYEMQMNKGKREIMSNHQFS